MITNAELLSTYLWAICMSLEKILAHFELKLFTLFATDLQEFYVSYITLLSPYQTYGIQVLSPIP